MAAVVGRSRTAAGRARMMVHLPADLRDRLARAAFEAGRPVSALVEEAVAAALAAAEAPPDPFERPAAQWTRGADGSWNALGAPCPAAGERGAVLGVQRAGGGWKWSVIVAAAGTTLAGEVALRSRTGAMLEAEAVAAALTEEAARAVAHRPGRRAKA